MKHTKTILALFFVLVTLFSSTACGKVLDKTPATRPVTTQPTTAQDKINKAMEDGDYTTAYELLYALESPTEEDLALMKCFRFFPVKEVEEENTFSGTRIRNTTYTYDDRGNMLTEEISNSSGAWEKYVYTYDNKNNLTGMEHTGDAANYTVTYTNKYDDLGNLIRIDTVSKAMDPITQALNVYDGTATILYTYDANGNALTCEQKNSSEQVTKWTRIYRGNTVVSYEMTGSDNSYKKILYFHDTAGNLTSMYKQDERSTVYYTYTYDSKGNMLTETQELSSITVYITYTYDDKGNMLKEEARYSTDSEPSYAYTYSYDKYGNETKKVETMAEYSGTTTNTTWQIIYNPVFAEEEKTESTQQATTVLEQAKAYIAVGAYENAYRLLYTQQTLTAEEAALLKCFRYLPTKEVSDNTTHTYTYDINGNMLTKSSLDQRGNLKEYIYTYDNDSKILTEKIISSNNTWETLNYTYDSNGNLQMKEYTVSNNGLSKLLYKDVFTCDEWGNILTRTTYERELERDPNAPPDVISDNYTWVEIGLYRNVYVYDDNGTILSHQYFWGENDWRLHEYTYDNNGKVLTEVISYSDGTGATNVYTYDGTGNLLSKETIGNTGITIKNTYTYDQHGNLLTDTVTGSYNHYTVSYEYSTSGALVRITTADESGSITEEITSQLYYNPKFAQEN